jgi:hypothetical protein
VPLRLTLRERLKPFIPYVDRLNVTDNTKSAENIFVQPDDSWIDLEVIRSWLRACERHHGGRCKPVTHNDNSLFCSPALLIDVERMCLVCATPDMKYFALSYVWGNSPSTCVLLANLHILQKKDALGNLVDLPMTIAHVIRLTKLLEGRYLWVDRLCIVQDDGLVKQAQLDRMGNIYAGAFATFVAASGSDARHGLKGISGVTGRRHFSAGSPRWLFSPAVMHSAFVDITTISKTPTADSYFRTTGEILVEQAQLLIKCKWFSRGWTFQENMFSRRKIIFQNETVNWECLCAAWHEAEGSVDNHHHQMPDNQLIPTSLGFDMTLWPDFYRFARLVSLYNRRHFSYPEDVMDAFAGVISMLSGSFTGGFITGLPQTLLDSALLWQPYTPINHRTRKGEQDACLTSWSWVGWHGDISSPSWRSGYDYIRKNPDEYYEKDSSIWQ